jgi:hypothetical protein
MCLESFLFPSKKCLNVLSSRAKNYVPKGTPATSGEISHPEALLIADKLSKFIEGRNGATSLSEINSQLTPIEGQATQHFRWKYIIIAGCKAAVSGVAIALLVYALSDDDKKKKKNLMLTLGPSRQSLSKCPWS